MTIEKKSQFLMVTGVARSGTTLLAEALDHHPEILCAPDPMNELFRTFMHFCYINVHGKRKSANDPMDHFFLQGSPAVFSFLSRTDMCHEIPDFMRGDLLSRISKRGGHYCPEIKEAVLKCRARRFDELILEMMELLNQAYGKESCRYFGFKDAWCEQMILPLSKTFPNMKFINIIRDPRAVVSSNYASKSSYPLFFNIRDWRKSVYYSWRYGQEQDLKSRFLSLKYEDLAANPQILQKVTDFLGVSFTESMIKTDFKPANTNYGESAQKTNISDVFKDKWVTHLPKDKRQQVELFCEPEMKRLGYEALEGARETINPLQTFWGSDVAFDKLGKWCRELVIGRIFYQTFWQWYQRMLEFIRLYLYRAGKASSRMSRKFFFDPDYFTWLVKGGSEIVVSSEAALVHQADGGGK